MTVVTKWESREMPAPACTEEGLCRECGSREHRGNCSWSLMRSGIVWVPMPWKRSVR